MSTKNSPERGYRVVEVLGKGAYGLVCVAIPAGETRRVVLKVLQSSLAHQPDALARARDEARLLSRLHHPHIVAVEALQEFEGRPVVVMEYIDGASLEALLRAQPQGLPPAETLEISSQVAQALANAWATRRVVHRDLKPSNILLSRDGVTKVVDFGLAYSEFVERESNTQDEIMGSMGFIAPERLHGTPPTPALDTYALGVTVAQLLTGKNLVLPHKAGRHRVRLRDQLALLSPPGVPAPALSVLRELLAQMCAFEPAQRPTPGMVAERMDHLVAHVGRPDLAAFAAERLPRPHPPRPPQEHVDWPEVAFLHDGNTIAPPPPASAEGPLRRLIRKWIR